MTITLNPPTFVPQNPLTCAPPVIPQLLVAIHSFVLPASSRVHFDLLGENPWLKLMLKLEILYGSLPQPPDLQSFVVCTWNPQSLSKPIVSRSLCVADAVAIWRSLNRSCVNIEMEIWLEGFQQNLGYGIDDGWLVMLLEHPVFTFRTYVSLVLRECNKDCLILLYDLCKFTRFRLFVESSTVRCGVVHELYIDSAVDFHDQEFSRQGENLKFAIKIGCLDLCEADHCDNLHLELLVHGIPVKISRNFRGLQVIAPLEDGSFDSFQATKIVVRCQHLSLLEACCFEASLILSIERLPQFHSCAEAHMRLMEPRRFMQIHSCVETHVRRMKLSSPFLEMLLQFHLYVSEHMRQMERRFSLLVVMEAMKNGFTSKWLDLHVIIGSQSCVSRLGKIWSGLAILIQKVSQPSMLCVDQILVQPGVLNGFQKSSRTNSLATSIHVGKGLCFKQGMFGWLKCSLFAMFGCSSTDFHSNVVFALCATLELMLTQSLPQPHLSRDYVADVFAVKATHELLHNKNLFKSKMAVFKSKIQVSLPS